MRSGSEEGSCQGSHTFVSLNSRLESNKEKRKIPSIAFLEESADCTRASAFSPPSDFPMKVNFPAQ